MSCSSKRNRLVGSCIRTLESSTNSLVVAFAAADRVDLRAVMREEEAEEEEEGEEGSSEPMGPSECFNKVEYLLDMAGHLHSAPLPAYGAVAIQYKSAALDAAHLLAVHVLHLDDAEERADFLVLVGEQIE